MNTINMYITISSLTVHMLALKTNFVFAIVIIGLIGPTIAH